MKLELTDAEKELLLGIDFTAKLRENEPSNGSGQASPLSSITGKRKLR